MDVILPWSIVAVILTVLLGRWLFPKPTDRSYPVGHGYGHPKPTPPRLCQKTQPRGWYCGRYDQHDGPCALHCQHLRRGPRVPDFSFGDDSDYISRCLDCGMPNRYPATTSILVSQ